MTSSDQPLSPVDMEIIGYWGIMEPLSPLYCTEHAPESARDQAVFRFEVADGFALAGRSCEKCKKVLV